MQQHFICNLTTQIQCVLKKYNVPTNKNSEIVSCCFFELNYTMYNCMQTGKKGGWVGGKAVASHGKKKKTGSHDFNFFTV